MEISKEELKKIIQNAISFGCDYMTKDLIFDRRMDNDNFHYTLRYNSKDYIKDIIENIEELKNEIKI